MSAEPTPSRKPRAVRPVAHHAARTSPADLVVIVAGVALCCCVAYVAWRTQIRGEKLETVLPFLASAPAPKRVPVSPAAPSPVDSLPTVRATPRGGAFEPLPPPGTSPAHKPGDGVSPDGDPDNTYFGRREHPTAPKESSKPR